MLLALEALVVFLAMFIYRFIGLTLTTPLGWGTLLFFLIFPPLGVLGALALTWLTLVG